MVLRRLVLPVLLVLLVAVASPLCAQQAAGGITGIVMDSTGAVVPGAVVTIRNVNTNLEIKASSQSDGSYFTPGLPIGDYSVSFAKEGFKTETHTAIRVEGNRTTTVNGKLEVGALVSTVDVVEVRDTPLLNQVDTTVGYVLDQKTIQETPLGTGSFTQLAILSPGVNADVLAGSGTNAGLGNQAIWANGQRDTSNSFSVNGVNANNIFNGKSSSQVSSYRLTANTGVSSAGYGETRTNTSVYSAIGQSLPTPPQEATQEMRVNTSQYDASHSPNSGAHIEVLTKSGTNDLHGQVYEYFQNTAMNAATFFRNANPSLAESDKVPALHYNRFGATLGGPIVKDKLFFFLAYQGIRDRDSLAANSQITVPSKLTDDRSAAGLSSAFGVPATSISPVSLALLNFKLPNGRYLLPSPTITDTATAKALGYNTLIQGPASTFTQNMGIADIDYNWSETNRFAFRFLNQDNPTTSPFGLSALDGFPETMQAGGSTASLNDTWNLSPTLTLDMRAGFIRQRAYATMSQPDGLTPAEMGINLFGSSNFPGIYLYRPDPTINTSNLVFGPNSNFSNAGIFQNKFQGSSTVSWFHGRHFIVAGWDLDHSQLNVINKNNEVADMEFSSSTTWNDFLQGVKLYAPYTYYFSGASNRYYRANQLGLFVQDKVRLSPNLNMSVGLRWDWNGPLVEKYGRLANFYPERYQYDAATDTVLNSGIVIAGNNPIMGTPGVSDSTLTGRQWGLGPRIGFAWTPGFVKNLVIRTGFGIYYDRGEFFSEFSPGAGRGFSGPFGVTLQLPFTAQISSTSTSTIDQPFGSVPQPAPTNANAITALLPNAAALAAGKATYLFSGYDPTNALPYTENWSFDMQWQPANSWVATLGYVGNRGLHLLMPIDFNQPGIATPEHPINGQIYSYGFNVIPTENLKTYDGGNTDLRVPYLGYSTNAMMWKAQGISTYNALQAGLQKRMSSGLQITASYTYSHALDEQSGMGLFYNGNNPLDPRQSYGTATFDRTHVFIASYLYDLPKLVADGSIKSKFVNGWGLTGVTVLQSGQPYNAYDFSGSVAGVYYGSTISVLDPIIGLAPGVTVDQAKLQGTTGIDPSKPLIDSSKFYVPTIAPGQMGVPPCVTNANGQQLCDNMETSFGTGGRNIFRGPFQERFDFALRKETRLNERFVLKFSGQVFNVFNHPVFDVPNAGSMGLYSVSSGKPTARTPLSSFGMIQGTLGSPRFVQLSMNLSF